VRWAFFFCVDENGEGSSAPLDCKKACVFMTASEISLCCEGKIGIWNRLLRCLVLLQVRIP